MIEFKVSGVNELRYDCAHLLPMHWKELKMPETGLELAPNWDVYYEKEKAGDVSIVIAYNEEIAIGYSVFFLYAHPHSSVGKHASRLPKFRRRLSTHGRCRGRTKKT